MELQTYFTRWYKAIFELGHDVPKSDRMKRKIKINKKRAKFREKFRQIIMNLIRIYDQKSHPLRTIDVEEIDEGARKRIVSEYFRSWKIIYASQVRFEVNAQYAISLIFNVCESKINLHQSKFFISLSKLASQKRMVEQVKKDFKQKGKIPFIHP
jgi:hypothetical protein